MIIIFILKGRQKRNEEAPSMVRGVRHFAWITLILMFTYYIFIEPQIFGDGGITIQLVHTPPPPPVIDAQWHDNCWRAHFMYFFVFAKNGPLCFLLFFFL